MVGVGRHGTVYNFLFLQGKRGGVTVIDVVDEMLDASRENLK